VRVSSWRYAKELRAELGAWRAARRQGGLRHATADRVRANLGSDPTVVGALEDVADRLVRVESSAESELEVARQEVGELRDRVARLEVSFEEARHLAAAQEAERRGRGELVERIGTVTAWVEQATLADPPLVSVVLPTRSARATWLVRAVESVVAQSYDRWELLIVCDGPEEREAVAATLDALAGDDRIRIVDSGGTGVSRARNVALDQVRGELVTYHDDDNTLGPSWLKAVAWAGRRWPDTEVFYGARVVEDPREYVGPRASDLPWLHLEPFDYRKLTRGNYIDQCVLAHRAGLHDVRYDEGLPGNVDWEVLLRVLRDREPKVLPVVACHYSTAAADRITGSAETVRAWTDVRARARELRPLRVLSYSFHYPVVEMTYVGEDMKALAQAGAEIAFCSEEPLSAPQPIDHVLYRNFEVAVRDFQPDVVVVHWLTFANRELARLQASGVPFAVRTHSFPTDVDATTIEGFAATPGCVGLWTCRELRTDHPKVHVLPQLFPSGLELPARAPEPDLVCSISAGLPKKEWGVLIEALGPMTGVQRRIVIGTTLEHERLPGEVILKAQAYPDPPLVQVNLTPDQVYALLARAAVVIYTLDPAYSFGCPFSVVSALAMGASVVVPDRPEARDLVGHEWFRGYRTSADIRSHVREVLAGGPVIAMEQAANRQRALETFCDPDHGKRFYDGLRSGIEGTALFPV
jgi:glycosyltransferase involved in cell wall biosynthesis